METGLIVTLLSLLVATTVAPAMASTAAAESSSCEQSVRHETFRTSEAVATFNETGEVTSTTSNTEVRVEDVPGFVRLHASNPNGYCVSYVVELSPEIVSPADLGEIESSDENTTASWRANQNLTSGVVYTRVELTLPANETATFAPSTVRVQSLSWTGTAKQESQSALSSIRSLFGDDEKLHKRTYQIAPTSSSSRITVPLENGGQEIEEWQATYEVDGTPRPVSQDASAPVYYTESSSSVTFHFSQEAVERGRTVRFVAEPGWLDKMTYSAESYWSGLSVLQDDEDDGDSWLPLSAGRIA
jgi:hypothetical protein